jgi:tRNA threonylcarbamoyladenosine dehydratase
VISHDSEYQRRFGGLARLYGEQGLHRLQAAHVIVVGLGGVGSWAAEAVARSGIGRLTLIDMDHVSESNINRQLPALGSTLGASKIDVMKARLLDVNPALQITLVDDWISSENVQTLLGSLPQPSVLIDAIDQPRAKAAMIAWATLSKVPIFVCGAAGGRRNVTQFGYTDIALTKGDALIASVRGRLRRDYGFSRVLGVKFGVLAVHSSEIPAPTVATDGSLNCGGYGSSVMVTASLGLAAANAAIEEILK